MVYYMGVKFSCHFYHGQELSCQSSFRDRRSRDLVVLVRPPRYGVVKKAVKGIFGAVVDSVSVWGLEDESVSTALLRLSLHFLHKCPRPLKLKNACV